jgi:hypothetical protein
LAGASPNPFESPTAPAANSGVPAGSLQYGEAYRYVFANPNWVTNVLLVTVCQLIPVIGPIVMLGYQFEIIEALHRDPRRVYPDFTFDRFVEYLKRGLWPFLVSLVAGFAVGIPMMVLFYILMGVVFVAASGVGGDAGPVVGVIGFLLASLAFVIAAVALSVLMMPMILRAGLAQDFGGSFNLDFIKNFLVRTWKEIVLYALFIAVTGIGLMLIGMLFCGVGTYVAAALLLLAQAHLYFQLYQLHLARGGEPIPLPLSTPPNLTADSDFPLKGR